MRGNPSGLFWGKLEKADSGEVLAWHPLVDHCADVAACLDALLERPLIRRRLAAIGGVADLDATQRARLAVLAALHDLGKFSRGFQAKASPAPAHVSGHVGPGLSLLGTDHPAQREAVDVVLRPLGGWGAEIENLLRAAMAHHGRPTQPTAFGRSAWEGQPLSGIRELAGRVRDWFPVAFEPGGDPLPAGEAFQHAFAGLVMLADWIGSDRRFFPFSESLEADRMQLARPAALGALRQIGLDADAARAVANAAPATFDRISRHPPRPAQAQIADLPLSDEGSTVLLESETGSGKTEAALFWFLRLFAAGLVDGMYFALPTRTAATQLHRRVKEARDRIFGRDGPPVVLAVPGYVRVDDVDAQALPDFKVLWPDDPNDERAPRRWAAEGTKRYLAGTIVVGTVDQVLLAALQVSHAHLRSAALLRHLLVVDEVHASDEYMTSVLCGVLDTLRRAKGHALLMSATLGAGARARLFGVTTRPSLENALGAPYPALGVRVGTGGAIVQPVPGRIADKNVQIAIRPAIDDAEAIAREALEAACRGARVLVLRNTVRGCLDVQAELERLAGGLCEGRLLFSCEGRPVPHHSRYAKADRERLDAAIELALGQGSTEPTIVVATQTVQQSLDLDADLLLTDLAPVDVLLQRIGRLHRHARPRLAGFEAPLAVVLVPAERDLSQRIGASGRGAGTQGIGRVYEDLRILEATWRQLERHPVWRIPSMNRALVEQSMHREVLDAIEREDEAWTHHGATRHGQTIAHRGLARLNLVDWSQPYPEAFFGRSDERVQTRLGAGDRLVAFDAPFTTELGSSVRELSLPAFLAGDIPVDAAPEGVRAFGSGIAFDFGPRTFVYDRLGLRPGERGS